MDKEQWRVWLTNYLPSRVADKVEPEMIGQHGCASGTRIEPRVMKPDDDDFVIDPYPVFRYLRHFEPLHRSDTGAWVLTRHADILQALADPRLGNAPSEHAAVNARNRDRFVCADVAANILPFINPPQHTLPRAIVSRRFHQYLRQHPVPYREFAREQLARVSDKPRIDCLGDFATPLACRVFMHLLQLPDEDQEKLIDWSEHLLYLFTALPSEDLRQAIDRALGEFRAYLSDHYDSSPCVLHQLLQAADENGRRLEPQQIIDNLMLLFADGIGNTDKAMASTLVCLQRHPEQLRRLQQDPSLVAPAIDECLRFESPAQYIGRVAREDVEWYGQTIKANETVLLVLASANRDETVFNNPDQLDITRTPNPHVSFGKSRHSCIGGPLVRQELVEVVSELLPVIEQIEVDFDKLVWDCRPGHRWLSYCPITLGSA